jgi:rod shape-determining protein MreC
MLRAASGYKRFFSLVIALTFVLFLFSPELQKKPVRLLGKPVGALVYYAQEGLYNLLFGIESIWYGYIDLIHVRQENLDLRRELSELKGEANRLREQEELASRLQVLLDYKRENPDRILVAKVIGRKLSHWYDTIMINRGEKDGIMADMGVVTPAGVVGKVVKTGPHFAQVLLITDRNSAVAAINQRTRDQGIVEGTEKDKIRMKYLPRFAETRPADVLVTSGLEGSFPKGILIGRVERVEKSDRDLFLQVEVVPAVDLSKIEEVLVVTGLGPE